MRHSRLSVIAALGTTQTLAWASTFYLPAILADSIAAELGISSAWFFAAFSAALAISALFGPRVGRTIDAIGGRGILAISNLVFAAGLILLGFAHGQLLLWLAWLVLGIGMSLGLYDSAFAALGRLYGSDARRAITGITLIAGFASTIGWPLSAWGLAELGWRETCFAWAAAHLVLGLPLNLLLLPVPGDAAPTATALAGPKPQIAIDRNMILLAAAFAAFWSVGSGVGTHLPRLLQACGATPVEAIFAGTLLGPAQVAARLLEAGLLQRFHPLLSARLASITHPIGALVVALFGAGGIAGGAFAILHGAGSGIQTIARGTVPLLVFGPVNYGYRLGLLAAPSRITQAAAPLVFGLMIDDWGVATLIVSAALNLLALACLWSVRPVAPASN